MNRSELVKEITGIIAFLTTFFFGMGVLLWFNYWLNAADDARSHAVRSVAAVSFDHDGHRWVRLRDRYSSLVHHPDCPCRANAERGAE